MESDRVHARAVIMRDAKNGEDAADAEGGWLDWLRDCGVPAITGVDTRALVRHIRDRGAMRGGIFAADVRRGRGARAVAAEPSMAGADFARTVTPGEPVGFDGDGPHVVGIDTGIKLSIIRQFRERDCRLTLLPCAVLGRGGPRPRTPTSSSSPTAPATRRRSTTSSTRPRAGRQAAGRRHLPRPPAALPGGRPRDLQAALRPPRRQPPGQGPRDRAGSTSPPRTTASRSAGPGGEATIEADEPVRWETDFGAAELSHLNLYDRTVEGLVLKDVPGCTVQYHPEAGPGPHDARYLFDRFLELAAA